MNPKKVAIEARLRTIWQQAGTETFVAAFKLFVEARIIAAQGDKDAPLQAAWELVDQGLREVEKAQADSELQAAWDEIDQTLEDSQPLETPDWWLELT